MSVVAFFPGHSSQHVGMGVALADAFSEAREVFQEVDDALSQKLSAMMRDGAESDLTLTENAQPALFAVSMAVVRVLEKQSGKPMGDLFSAAAGHSLGEYSALASMGALAIADGAKLLRLRGQAMQQAVPAGEGAMAAILGPELDAVRGYAAAGAAEAGGVCDVANDNAPGQVVVSGAVAAVDAAIAAATADGVKRCMKLPVSAPFHCALMKPAADQMADALAEAAIATPARHILCNVSAEPIRIPGDIRARLVEQVCGTVRWRESVLRLRADGAERAFELGAGKVLTGLAKRIDRDLTCAPVGAPEDIETALGAL
ncbi:MAG: ACP S-malonyltransferase [Pseudomonadota bacterium]